MNNNQIHFRAEITIEEGKTEEFKELIQDLSKMVEANEPDTIEYQFYINGSDAKCMVHETYRNSEAAITHNNGVAPQKILPRIFNISKITRFDVYGNPSKELQKVLTSIGVQTHYNLFVGFCRH
jgi:quinol monooxygenase YgiN